jgi:hypothetical protein
MIASRHGRGWQTIIADLALILFMVTAAAMQRGGQSGPDGASDALPLHGEPLAVYRPSHGTPPLRQWLAAQAPDERQRLTVVARYAPGEAQQVSRAALAMAADSGTQPRIVIEPGGASEVLAVIAFDSEGDWHADCTGGPVQGAQGAARKDDSCE